MKTFKSITIAILLFASLFSCAEAIEPQKIENHKSSIFHEAYELKNGVLMVVVKDPASSKLQRIQIDLEDEVSKYFFAYGGFEYEIEYQRTGSDKLGCTGVFVIFEGEIYRINSPYSPIKR